MTKFIVNETDAEGRPVGELAYPPGRRVPPGTVVDDLPARSIKGLVHRGVIAPAPPDHEEGR